jgi:two-component system, LytTR family, response regulator
MRIQLGEYGSLVSAKSFPISTKGRYTTVPMIPTCENSRSFRALLGKAIQSIRQATAPPAADALLQYFRNLNSRKIAVPNKNGFSYYNIEEIISLEAAGSYTRIHFSNNKQILVSRGLRDFELHLAEKGFLRVHKSYLINMEYIAEFHRGDNGYLVMSDGSKIHLSSKDKGEIIKKIKEFSNII